MEDFASRFIRGFQAGNQQKQAKQAEADRAEDRKLEKELLKHKLREIGIQEKLQARNLAKDNFGMAEGRPASEFPVSGVSAEGVLPGGMPHLDVARKPQPMNIPGVPELGVGDVQMTPRTMEDVLKQQAQAKLNEPFNLAPGASRFAGGQVVARNPAPERPAALQVIDTVIGGVPTKATFNPQTGEVKPIAGARPFRAGRAGGSGGGSGSGGGAGAGSGDPMVEAVMTNPDLWQSLTPTVRTKIGPALVRRGFTQFGKQAAGNAPSAAKAVETAAEVARVAKELRDHAGFNGAFGVMDSVLPTFKQKTADAEVLRDRLQALLTMENMDAMKGVLSDSDIKMLQKASTSLSGRMSEAAAKAELNRLIPVMERAAKAVAAAPAGARKVGGFIVEDDK